MYCDLGPVTSQDATIIIPTTSLSALPAASDADFGGRAPWSVLTTRTLVALLHLDRGVFATWRCRGIGPAALPSTWFKPASGRPCYYMLADVLAWLAARRGEPFDADAAHLAYLRRHLGDACATPEWVRRMAEGEGPNQGDVRFTPRGWLAYLDRLARA